MLGYSTKRLAGFPVGFQGCLSRFYHQDTTKNHGMRGGWEKTLSTNIPPRSACSIAYNMPSFSGRNGRSTTISTPNIIPKPSTNQLPPQTRRMHREAHTKTSKNKALPHSGQQAA
ncbi:unnamed protein product, partial [Ectocarpus sp. 8 AP-2014]